MINQDGRSSGLASSPAPATGVDITDVAGEALRGALEAVLFVADEPVLADALASVVGAPAGLVEPALRQISDDYTSQRRGFDLRQVAGGWRLYTRDCFAGVVERHLQQGQQARLTQASLETLAIVAYRQPVARARVAAIRGVGVDGVFRSLIARGLIEECGNGGPSGALLYRTTASFLEQLGLNDITDLPSLAPLLPDTAEVEDDSSSI